MLVYLLILVASMALVNAAVVLPDLDPPYCAVRYRRLCQGKGRHVACQFPAPGPGESCVNYTLIKFTKDLRHFVTHYINRRRQRIAMGSERVRGGVHLPRPEVMMQVEWDRELALLAQRLADQCSFVHDDCRATVRFPYAGQTVGEVKWRRTSESDMQNVARAIRRVLDAWWGERRRVTVKQLTRPFRVTNKGNVWGHFSQLAVWTLRAVGCGAVRHGNKHPKILLVCDFSHTNMLGQRTIVPGPLGSCPIHTARKQRSPYPMLCAPVRHQDVDQLNSKSDDRRPMEYGVNNDEDEVSEIEDVDDMDELVFDDGTQDVNEYTSTTRPHTQKRMRVNTWDDTERPYEIDQETEGNDISQEDELPLDNESSNEKPQPKKLSDRKKPQENLQDDDYELRKNQIRGKGEEKSNNAPVKLEDEVNNVQGNRESQEKGGCQKFDEITTKVYKIKKIRDRLNENERGWAQEDEKSTEIPPERERPHDIIVPEREKEFETKEPQGREKVKSVKAPPERERFSMRKDPFERTRTFQYSDGEREEEPHDETGINPGIERLLEVNRQLERDRYSDSEGPLRDSIPERMKPEQRERPTKIDRPTERYRMPARKRPTEKLPDWDEEIPAKDMSVERERPEESEKDSDDPEVISKAVGFTNRYRPTTDTIRTRYMINVGDIQRHQKNFMDLKNVGKEAQIRQKEFHRLQGSPGNKLTTEPEAESYRDASTPQFKRPQGIYSHNKYRLNEFTEYDTSSRRNLLESFKTSSEPAAPRTQFYEPVRHRWRPTKDRPERPGAKALVTNAFLYTTTRPPAAMKNTVTFSLITMDKDDVEQLFKDTGFKQLETA